MSFAAHKPRGDRTAEWKSILTRVVNNSNATAALDATPAAVDDNNFPTSGVLDVQDAPAVRLFFGGTDAADETINYQVLAWYPMDSDMGLQWLPRLIASGVATLGAMAMPTAFQASNGLMADQITDTISDAGNSIEGSGANDRAAFLYLKMRNAAKIQVEVDVDTAARADVFAQLCE